jgi:hypothetical protein
VPWTRSRRYLTASASAQPIAKPTTKLTKSATGCMTSRARSTTIQNEPFKRSLPVPEGFTAAATATPASVLPADVVVKFFAVSFQ